METLTAALKDEAAARRADAVIFGSRIELLCDGKLILGTSAAKRPENHAEMATLLKELIEIMDSPSVPDDRIL